jgi:hypothetical protein
MWLWSQGPLHVQGDAGHPINRVVDTKIINSRKNGGPRRRRGTRGRWPKITHKKLATNVNFHVISMFIPSMYIGIIKVFKLNQSSGCTETRWQSSPCVIVSGCGHRTVKGRLFKTHRAICIVFYWLLGFFTLLTEWRPRMLKTRRWEQLQLKQSHFIHINFSLQLDD